jgi:light-independent protochlorophyllide reductase subunit B
MMGLEEHLLTMFREDFEFNDTATPSHLASIVAAPSTESGSGISPESKCRPETSVMAWDAAAEHELKKIPFFVRGKARRNTERFATERGVETISVETLYEAKAHYGR